MTPITKRPAAAKSKPTRPHRSDARVDDEVRCRIDSCSYSFVFNKITWRCEEGRLILHGRVPSFYLKQVLQELLKNIECVDCIENNVDVVSSNGLSSEPRKKPRQEGRHL